MKLYYLPHSHFASKVRIVAQELDMDLDLIDLSSLSDRSEFESNNPRGLVPMMFDGDLALGESEVIVEYLNDRYGRSALLPDSPDQRAKSRWLSRVHDLYLAPELSQLFGALASPERDTDAVAQVAAAVENHLDDVERHLENAPYAFGEQFGLADACFGLSLWYARWLLASADRPVAAARYPRVLAWAESLQARPSVANVIGSCVDSLDRIGLWKEHRPVSAAA